MAIWKVTAKRKFDSEWFHSRPVWALRFKPTHSRLHSGLRLYTARQSRSVSYPNTDWNARHQSLSSRWTMWISTIPWCRNKRLLSVREMAELSPWHQQSSNPVNYMVSYQWTVRSKRVVGRLPIGAWVEIIKTNTTAKPTPLEIFRAFESKYGMKIPTVSTDQCFEIIKNFWKWTKSWFLLLAMLVATL